MWSQTLGQDRPIAVLQKTLQSGKVPHAFLFCGLEGIGKRRAATGLAQALNCESKTSAPCSQCPSCQKIEKNIHPDCLWIEPEGKFIKIETLREVKQKAYLHPLEGAAKIFLIDPAEAMTESAANALLKILEEPPAQTFFVLITSKPSLLLPTTRSRCQSLDFAPLTEEVLGKILSAAGFSGEEAKRRAALAQGSASRALEWDLELFAQAESGWEKLQASPPPSLIFKLSEAYAKDDETLPFILRSFEYLAHQRLMAASERGEIERRAGQWQAVAQAIHLLETSANKRLLLEDLLFRLRAA